MKNFKNYKDFLNENFLNENFLDSKFIGDVIHSNLRKTKKGGGKISISVKSNNKTTAEINISVYYDKDSKSFPKVDFFDKETYPNLDMFYVNLVWNNKQSLWVVNSLKSSTEVSNATNTNKLKNNQKYSDEEMADIFNGFFNSIK